MKDLPVQTNRWTFLGLLPVIFILMLFNWIRKHRSPNCNNNKHNFIKLDVVIQEQPIIQFLPDFKLRCWKEPQSSANIWRNIFGVCVPKMISEFKLMLCWLNKILTWVWIQWNPRGPERLGNAAFCNKKQAQKIQNTSTFWHQIQIFKFDLFYALTFLYQ